MNSSKWRWDSELETFLSGPPLSRTYRQYRKWERGRRRQGEEMKQMMEVGAGVSWEVVKLIVKKALAKSRRVKKHLRQELREKGWRASEHREVERKIRDNPDGFSSLESARDELQALGLTLMEFQTEEEEGSIEQEMSQILREK